MTDRLLGAAALLLLSFSLAAQQDPARPLPKLPVGETLLTLPSPHIPAQGVWEIKFTHRFNQSLDQGSLSDQLHSLFGLDSNADVNFGLSYTRHRNLQFAVARSNTNDTLEGVVKYVALEQSGTVPLTLALRVGADWRTERNLDDRLSFLAQAIVSRKVGTRAEFYALPTFVTNGGRGVTSNRSEALFDHAFNIPLGAAYLLRPGLSLVAEIIPPNRDLPDDSRADPGWAFGIKRALGGHWFEVLVTNSQATTADQYVTSTFQGSPLEVGNLHLGFNIARRFGRRR